METKMTTVLSRLLPADHLLAKLDLPAVALSRLVSALLKLYRTL